MNWHNTNIKFIYSQPLFYLPLYKIQLWRTSREEVDVLTNQSTHQYYSKNYPISCVSKRCNVYERKTYILYLFKYTYEYQKILLYDKHNLLYHITYICPTSHEVEVRIPLSWLGLFIALSLLAPIWFWNRLSLKQKWAPDVTARG